MRMASSKATLLGFVAVALVATLVRGEEAAGSSVESCEAFEYPENEVRNFYCEPLAIPYYRTKSYHRLLRGVGAGSCL